jgi:hypothetical protein
MLLRMAEVVEVQLSMEQVTRFRQLAVREEETVQVTVTDRNPGQLATLAGFHP